MLADLQLINCGLAIKNVEPATNPFIDGMPLPSAAERWVS
jgi:hypothetical protein